jgi:UDPglucose 6-dehydrogenase
VVTEWSEFRSLPLAELAELMATPVLVDGRNIISPEAAKAAGFDYAGIGRSPRSRAEMRESRRAAARSVT